MIQMKSEHKATATGRFRNYVQHNHLPTRTLAKRGTCFLTDLSYYTPPPSLSIISLPRLSHSITSCQPLLPPVPTSAATSIRTSSMSLSLAPHAIYFNTRHVLPYPTNTSDLPSPLNITIRCHYIIYIHPPHCPLHKLSPVMPPSKGNPTPPPPHYLTYPSFTKCLTGDRWDTQMKIPSDFIVLYDTELTLSAPDLSLTTCCGSSMVKMEMLPGQSCKVGVRVGWSDFIVRNDIDRGDILTFLFTGTSSFSVALFDNRDISKNNEFYAKGAVPKVKQETSDFELLPRTTPTHSPPPTGTPQACINQLIILTKTRRYNMAVPKHFFTAAGLHKMKSVKLSNAAGGTWVITLGDCRLGGGGLLSGNQTTCMSAKLSCSNAHSTIPAPSSSSNCSGSIRSRVSSILGNDLISSESNKV